MELELKNALLVDWEVTQRCNLNCVFCAIKNLKYQEPFIGKKELRVTEIAQLGEAISEHALRQGKHVFVFWTGGEPLLELKKMLECSKFFKEKLGFDLGITTNGVLLTRAVARKILSTLRVITISIDGIRNTHNILRGASIYTKVITNLKLLVDEKRKQKSDVIICIATVLTHQNVREFKSIVHLASNIGVDRITIFPMQYDKDSKVYSLYGLKEDDIPYLYEIYDVARDQSNVYIDMPREYFNRIIEYINNTIKRPRRCFAGENFIFIDAYGNIFPCCSFFPKDLGEYFLPLSDVIKLITEDRIKAYINAIRANVKFLDKKRGKRYNACDHCLNLCNIKLCSKSACLKE